MIPPIVGWIGVAISVGAHATFAFWSGMPLRLYFGANLVAAIAVSSYAFGLQSWQSAGVNVFWAVVSIRGIADIMDGTSAAVRPGASDGQTIKAYAAADAPPDAPHTDPAALPRRLTPSRAFLAAVVAVSLVSAVIAAVSVPIGRELFGWIYLATYCFGYLLLALGHISRTEYFAYAVYASSVGLPALLAHGNYPGFFVNVIWGALSVPPVMQAVLRYRRHSRVP